jgi:hypothetical protein
MAKTGSERVRAWRIRNLRKFYRTEILLSQEDAAKLDMLCTEKGLDRSSVIRELIQAAKLTG